MSKVLEKLVARRLEGHKCTNNLYDPLQSAYRSQHSTETAILKIHNSIIEGLDAGKCTVLSSLDLSAAFDIVVYVNGVLSVSRDTNCGVSQGSVLGAQLYTMCVYP